MAVAGDQEIGVAVIIEIGGDYAEAVAIARDAGLIGHVGELAVAVITVKVIVRHGGRRFTQGIGVHSGFEWPAAHYKKIGFAVVVVIEPGAARASAFE